MLLSPQGDASWRAMKLKSIKTLIFVTISVVFAAGSIYNYKKQSAEPADILRIFDGGSVAVQNAETTDDPPAEEKVSSPVPGNSETEGQHLININTADRAELESLPGIGPVKAKAIMEYRSRYKGFVAKEEIMEVKGIGPATYEKIKDKITIE